MHACACCSQWHRRSIFSRFWPGARSSTCLSKARSWYDDRAASGISSVLTWRAWHVAVQRGAGAAHHMRRPVRFNQRRCGERSSGEAQNASANMQASTVMEGMRYERRKTGHVVEKRSTGQGGGKEQSSVASFTSASLSLRSFEGAMCDACLLVI